MLGNALSTAVVLFHQAIADRLGLSATEWKCLSLLRQAGSVTAGRLAEETGLTTGAITGIVDRLERAGRARRASDPADRRRVIIERIPDPNLDREVAAIFGSLTTAMYALIARYNEHEQAVIRDYLVTTIEILQRETAKLQAGRGEG